MGPRKQAKDLRKGGSWELLFSTTFISIACPLQHRCKASCDVSGIYEKLEDIFGKLDDETEQFDEDEMGEMEPDGEHTETAGESAEAKEDDDDSIHGFNFGMLDWSFMFKLQTISVLIFQLVLIFFLHKHILPLIFIFSNEFIYPFMIACIPVFAIHLKPNNEFIQTNSNLCVCCFFTSF